MTARSLLLFCLVNLLSSGFIRAQKASYNGRYAGDFSGMTITAELKATGNKLSGKLVMNGQAADITGTLRDSSSQGTMLDLTTQMRYNYSSRLSGAQLTFSIVYPELNNQVVDLVLYREQAPAPATAGKAATKTSGKPRDKRLLGTWRYTEVLSSGYGGNYGSLATDYFLEFRADGSVLSWTGSSAGGTSGVLVEGGGSGADKGEWYTQGKTLYLVDPVTGQQAATQFMADANNLLLQNGSTKKIYQRIR
jgi:hypothetical protein